VKNIVNLVQAEENCEFHININVTDVIVSETPENK
jgi:hypothetical protein